MKDRPERFVYRYEIAEQKIEAVFLKEKTLYTDLEKQLSLKEKDEFCLELKYAYEYCWKTMKDVLKSNNIIELLPRKIFNKMRDFDFEPQYWLQFIDHINDFFLHRHNVEIKDKIIENYFNHYKNMLLDFKMYMSILIKNSKPNKKTTKDYIYENHYILDTRTFYTLIECFRNHSEISKVYLYGSRALNTFRKSSDIDLLIDGDFSIDLFETIKHNIETLKLPYLIDAHSIKTTDKARIEFNNRNLADSILLYDREDFK